MLCYLTRADFMRERKLPAPLRIMAREYFESARMVHQVSLHDRQLLHQMSPKLCGTIAVAANKKWLDQVRLPSYPLTLTHPPTHSLRNGLPMCE